MSVAGQLIELDGSRVSLKGEMVSLTGLWKAAGSDPSKKPSKWRELPSTQEFIAYVEEVTVRKSDSGLVVVQNGGKSPGTWAHWHIAMGYARYLDPAFAVRCNEVVRAHMERQLAPAFDIPAEVLELLRRTDGIVRMLAKKVTAIEKSVAGGGRPMPAFTITIKPDAESAE